MGWFNRGSGLGAGVRLMVDFVSFVRVVYPGVSDKVVLVVWAVLSLYSVRMIRDLI